MTDETMLSIRRKMLCVTIQAAISNFQDCDWNAPFALEEKGFSILIDARALTGTEYADQLTREWISGDPTHQEFKRAEKVCSNAIAYAVEIQKSALLCKKYGKEAIEILMTPSSSLQATFKLLKECDQIEKQYPREDFVWEGALLETKFVHRRENPKNLEELFSALKQGYISIRSPDIPSFGGFKPGIDNIVSWDEKELILTDDFGNLVLDSRIDDPEGTQERYADELEIALFEDN